MRRYGEQVKTWGNIVKSISKTYDKHKKNIGKHIRKAYGETIQKAHKESIRNKEKGTPLAPPQAKSQSRCQSCVYFFVQHE